MRPVLHWVVLPAALVSAPCAMHAVQYLTVASAQQSIFPGATLTPDERKLTEAQRKAVETASGVTGRLREFKLWRVEGGGWFIVDEVIGKHEFITYALGLDAGGAVIQIEVLDYREHYGSAVRDEKWRSQFRGKTKSAKLRLREDIKNISGATLSCRHLTEGVKRLLALHDIVLKH